MKNKSLILIAHIGLAMLLLVLTAGSASAIRYELTAEEITITMPDATNVTAWGFRLTSDAPGSATVPGPTLEVPFNHTRLIIDLTNNLPEATSLHILGQTLVSPGAPRMSGGRVISFVKHTTPNTTRRYRWDNFNPGTFMLQSARHPARQVQMGLFAPVKKDSGPNNEAYPGVIYDEDRVLVFHEIDPDFQNNPRDRFIVHRHPRYFLINGAGYPDTNGILADVAPGQTVLLRFINAGLETHAPQILNKYLSLVAQDGYPRSYEQQVYGFELNSAGTMDALLQVDPGDGGQSFPIYDGRVKNLTNAGASPGGMLVKLNVTP
jgi:FtsP/CotA-like multicopper oxidase with cupredoxin domain